MSESIMETNNEATEPQETSQATGKTYSEDEFNKHMAGMRKSLEAKFEKQFADLGDIEELKQLKAKAEQSQQEEALKRGEFEKILQSQAQKKDAEIAKRDAIIKEYKIDAPLLNAASQHRSVNPDQVKALLKNQVTLGENGETIVTDSSGTLKFKDDGSAYTVDDLVGEFLQSNPHFVQPTPSSTNTRSNVADSAPDFDISRLDMSKPEDRQKYAQWRAKK